MITAISKSPINAANIPSITATNKPSSESKGVPHPFLLSLAPSFYQLLADVLIGIKSEATSITKENSVTPTLLDPNKEEVLLSALPLQSMLLLVVGCWLLLLVVGCWLLVVGCWLLVVGCWLLVVG